MNKIVFVFFLLLGLNLKGQYAPAPGQVGSTAIAKDSSVIVAWATGISLQRGFLDINDTLIMDGESNKVSYGLPQWALYGAEGNSFDCVSLGDSGIAILDFESTIYNGPGPDFAIFENSFGDDYLELAFVEVSSDGINYARFPSFSQVPFAEQIGPYSFSDCEAVHNLAGKYRQGFGTPFDLEELAGIPNIDVNHIKFVKIVDVIGSITGVTSSDSEGNIINDPYPTAFSSGGFDLDAVGVMYLNEVGVNENELSFLIYPNPTSGVFSISSSQMLDLKIYTSAGKLLIEQVLNGKETIDLSSYGSGVFLCEIKSEHSIAIKRILIH